MKHVDVLREHVGCIRRHVDAAHARVSLRRGWYQEQHFARYARRQFRRSDSILRFHDQRCPEDLRTRSLRDCHVSFWHDLKTNLFSRHDSERRLVDAVLHFQITFGSGPNVRQLHYGVQRKTRHTRFGWIIAPRRIDRDLVDEHIHRIQRIVDVGRHECTHVEFDRLEQRFDCVVQRHIIEPRARRAEDCLVERYLRTYEAIDEPRAPTKHSVFLIQIVSLASRCHVPRSIFLLRRG